MPLEIDHPLTFFSEMALGPCLNLSEYKSTPVVSDAERNSRSTAVPNTFSVSASKYVIIIYAFGSAHEKFGV